MSTAGWTEKRTQDGRRYFERRIDSETVERRFADTEIRTSEHGGNVTLAEKRSLLELRSPAALPTMRGRFAVFNEWTEIRGREGRFLERIGPKAFDRTIVEDRTSMRVLYDHGQDPTIGNKPLGVIADLQVRSDGPYYEVPLFDTAYTRELIPGLEAGVYGASFRFRTVSDLHKARPERSSWNPKGLPETTLTEVRVLEFGPCTFPAYSGATAIVGSAPPPVAPRAAAVAKDPIRRSTGRACVEVRVLPKVIDRIKRYVWCGNDGLETGGFLAGTWDGRAVYLTDATESVAKRSKDALTLDVRDLNSMRMYEGWGKQFGAIGTWHLHPAPRDPRPSPTDFGGFEAAHEYANLTRFEPYGIGLIVTPDKRGSLASPDLHVWASRQEKGRYVTEPARLVAA